MSPVSLLEAKELLQLQYQTQLHYVEEGLLEELRTPYLSGYPGVGKTSLTKLLSHELHLPYHRIDVSTFEYYELKGLLYIDEKQLVTKIVELDVIPTSPSLLCLDEINAADYSLQKVLSSLVYERKIVNRKLHDETFVICCGNPSDTVEGMYDLLSHLRDRLIEIELQPTFDELLCRIVNISLTAYNVYYNNYTIVKKWFLQHKSMRQLTAASYPIEMYCKTKDEKWLKLIELYLGDLTYDLSFDKVETKVDVINNIQDVISIVVNIEQYTPDELKQFTFDKNVLFNVQQYCQMFNLLDKWKSFLQKLGEDFQRELAEWLVGR